LNNDAVGNDTTDPSHKPAVMLAQMTRSTDVTLRQLLQPPMPPEALRARMTPSVVLVDTIG
jgi:hypothetical protein